MNTFSGEVYVNSSRFGGRGTLTTLLCGYDSIPPESRISALETLSEVMREALLKEDERQQRVSLDYRMTCLSEVSAVEGSPLSFQGKVVEGARGKTTTHSDYGPLEVPTEEGAGGIHYVRFRLALADGTPLLAQDIAKADVGDVPGFALHFEV